jgi:outer membrane protein
MKQKLKWLAIITVTAITTTGYQSTAQSASMDMKTAIETAISNNYSLKADSMNLQSARYQSSLANAAFMPQLKLSNRNEYNPTIQSQMLPGTMVGQPGKELVPVQMGTSYNLLSSMEVSQSIFNKPNYYNKVYADINISITQTKHNLTREELVYKVAIAFYSLQATAEQIRLTHSDYNNMAAITKIAKEQFNNGILQRIDYESLGINTANLLSQLNQLNAGYDEQLTYFKYLLGVPVNSDITISTEIKNNAEMVSLVDDELSGRQDIRLYRQMMQAKQVEISSIKSEKLPVISSYFRYNYQSQFNNASDAFKSDYRFSSSTVGVSVSVSLFDGFRRKNRTNIATTQLKQLHFQSELQKQLASAERKSAYEKYRKDQQNFHIAKQNLAIAEKVFTSRKALYTEGVTTLIELLDAESELTKSRNLSIQALVNVQTSLLNMYKSKGTLLTDFIKSI